MNDKTMTFEEWVEEHEDFLIDKYCRETVRGRMALDDQLPALVESEEFIEWAEELYEDGWEPDNSERIA